MNQEPKFLREKQIAERILQVKEPFTVAQIKVLMMSDELDELLIYEVLDQMRESELVRDNLDCEPGVLSYQIDPKVKAILNISSKREQASTLIPLNQEKTLLKKSQNWLLQTNSTKGRSRNGS